MYTRLNQGPRYRPLLVGRVSRPKVGAPGRHCGALLPNGMVAHLEPSGASIVPPAVFAKGRPLRFDAPVPRHLHGLMMERARVSLWLQPRYRPLTYNCEHHGHWVACEAPRSEQVMGAAVVCVAVLAVYAASASNPSEHRGRAHQRRRRRL
jgi:hypothetical protein